MASRAAIPLAVLGPFVGLHGLGEFARRRWATGGGLLALGVWLLAATGLLLFVGLVSGDPHGAKVPPTWLRLAPAAAGGLTYIVLWAYGVALARRPT